MTHEAVLQELQEMIRTLFDDPSLVIGEETRAADVEGWDSLEHINLINLIESRFKIRFEMKEALAFQNVGDMVRCVLSKTS
ncbi:MAG: acyl carrier protein [Saccharofermentanales bacterium]